MPGRGITSAGNRISYLACAIPTALHLVMPNVVYQFIYLSPTRTCVRDSDHSQLTRYTTTMMPPGEPLNGVLFSAALSGDSFAAELLFPHLFDTMDAVCAADAPIRTTVAFRRLLWRISGRTLPDVPAQRRVVGTPTTMLPQRQQRSPVPTAHRYRTLLLPPATLLSSSPVVVVVVILLSCW